MGSWSASVTAHEAGHAVAYFHAGVPISRVEVSASGDGWCTPGRVPSDPRSRLMAYAAGAVAEERWLRERGELTAAAARSVESGSRIDRQKAEIVCLARLGGDRAAFDRAADAAAEVLAARWRQVLAVAAELNRHGRLSGEAALAAATAAGGPAFPPFVTLEEQQRMRAEVPVLLEQGDVDGANRLLAALSASHRVGDR